MENEPNTNVVDFDQQRARNTPTDQDLLIEASKLVEQVSNDEARRKVLNSIADQLIELGYS